ncbi:MAG TPA: response regulator [Trichocoleus sp.]
MRVLLVEDDAVLTDILLQTLKQQHYVVDIAEDGLMGWDYAQDIAYDLILMDVGLPKLDGISLCQRLRSNGCAAPILLITARDAKTDRIRGLDAGADDYLVKPLDLGEFQARVRALLRRAEGSHNPVLEVGALQLNPITCQVTYRDRLLPLTPKEYSLLELFLRNPLRVFSRGNIIEHLWTYDDPPQEESVKAHIKGLRQKLKTAGAADWIENVYGLGYRLNPKEADAGNQGEGEKGESEKSPLNLQSPPVEQQFNQTIDRLWTQYEELMSKRMAVLQQMVEGAQRGDWSEETRQAAVHAAHKLAGVLGMFGREKGTTIARQIEQFLLETSDYLPEQVQQLSQWAVALQAVMQPSKAEPVKQLPQDERDDRATQDRATQDRATQVKLLVVDDDPVFLAALRPMLEPWGIQMTALQETSQFWQMLNSLSPDLLILDVEMPQQNGIELCEAVRQDATWQGLPILFLTAHQDLQTVQKVFKAGADDYIVKPVVEAELLTRLTSRLERVRLLQTFSTKDPLTGLLNQPTSNRKLEALLCRSTPIAFVVLTLPELQQINLQQGHETGNQVLQRVGQLCQSLVQEAEGLGYWGNGEFVFGLPEGREPAIDRLAPLWMALRQQVFTAPDGTRFQVAFQYGVAESSAHGKAIQLLYQAASSQLSAA